MHAVAFAPSPVRTAPRRRSAKPVRMTECVGPTDEDLLLRIAGGDREAFALTFSKYAPRVKSYLLRLGAPSAQAEDLAQDAMVSVWRRAASFDPGRAKASTWIFVIARNSWIDRLRREKVELAYREYVEPPQAEEAPDDALARGDSETRIRAALETLSEEQRQVVRLSFFEDKPHSEIAQELALPLGTVKSRLRLAMMKLRAQWGEQ